MNKTLTIIGAGLAGSEAAWAAANRGINVILHEMRPHTQTPAHKTSYMGELVCSNSFRSDDANTNAVGLLHQELRQAGSLIMACADNHKVPAGGALAVDRDAFAQEVTVRLESHPNITIKREEITSLAPFDGQNIIIATGPLTSEALSQSIQALTGIDSLSFFDAIAPIIYTETINMDICWYQSRYDKVGPGGNGKDYINCPLDKDQYYAFVDALLNGEKVDARGFENVGYFDGCLPIEVMAERGLETLRHGPMKPRGLTNKHQPDIKPYGVVQLRQDNKLGTLYNMVGFQTKLKYGAQSEIFKMIPGLEQASFARLGGLHRNTYLNSPALLDGQLRLKAKPSIRFAGQITGCEGYVESSAMGLLAGLFALGELRNTTITQPPETTAFGALLAHITGGHIIDTAEKGKKSFQPMNVNFGLFPPLEEERTEDENIKKKQKSQNRKTRLTERAMIDFDQWLKKSGV